MFQSAGQYFYFFHKLYIILFSNLSIFLFFDDLVGDEILSKAKTFVFVSVFSFITLHIISAFMVNRISLIFPLFLYFEDLELKKQILNSTGNLSIFLGIIFTMTCPLQRKWRKILGFFIMGEFLAGYMFSMN